MPDFTEQQQAVQDLIQQQIGDETLVMKWVLVVEFNDGNMRSLGKLTSPEITYWDWFGMVKAIEHDVAVDWTGVLTEDNFEDEEDDE